MTQQQFVELRKRLNIARSELAKILGVTREQVYRWEKVKFNPRRETYDRIIALDDAPKIIRTTTIITEEEHGGS